MNICLLGIGLSNLVLAKVLVNKGIKVHLCHNHNITKKSLRTIGITKKNMDFLKKQKINFEKISNPPKKIFFFFVTN